VTEVVNPRGPTGKSREIFKNTAILSAAQILERVTGLLLAFFISRQLGAGGLGIYVTATAYFAVIAVAAQGGSTNLLVREIAKHPAKTNDYLVHASVLATGLSLVLMGLAWIVVPHLGQSPSLRSGLQLIVIAIVPGTLRTIQEAVFVAHQRVIFQTYATFVSSIVTVAVSLYLLRSGHGVVSLLATFVAIQYAVTISYFALIHRYIVRLRPTFNLSFARELLREMRAFAGISVMAGIFARAEVVMLSLIASEAQVGLYSAALKIVDLWSFIPQTLMINVFPVLSRSFHLGDKRAQKIQNLALKYLLAISLPLSIGLAVTADQIIRAFYGKGFGDSVLVLQILAANVTVISIWAVLWRMLAARGEQGSVLRAQTITVVVRLGLGYVLIAWLASVGAAIITVVSLALYALLLAADVRRDGTRIPLPALGWRSAAAALGMGLVTASLSGTVKLWLLIPVAAILYAALALLFRAFSAEDVARIREMVSFGGRPRRA
jgi:O-antigen/teichoic acid export membrane protein